MDPPREPVAPEELNALAELVYLALDAVEAGERPEAEDLLQRALATLAGLGAAVELDWGTPADLVEMVPWSPE